MTTWFITGCSTGLGRHLARAVLERGWNAVVTARNASAIEDIVAAGEGRALGLPLDVTNREQIASAIEAARARFGGIDVLVNNAGYGYRAAVEEGNEAEVADMFATNFFGLVAVTKAALPVLRAQRSGTIINISSTAGRVAQPGSGYYSASKFAVAGMSEALRKEVAPLGIRVIVVEPGGFRTDFAGRSLQQAHSAIGDYAATAGPRRKENDKSHGRQPGDPARGAQAIISAALDASPPSHLVLGRDALARIREEVDSQREELDRWAHLSIGTDFDASA